MRQKKVTMEILPLKNKEKTGKSTSEECLAWLAMVLTPGIGPKRILEAVAQMGDAAEIFSTSLTGIEALRFPASSAQYLFEGKGRAAAEQEMAQAAALGVELVCHGEERYPERLREIYDPPPVLWVKGSVELLARPGIAIVGTRHPSPYGAQVAQVIARDLAARRVTIISGMARGIDSSAHRGALDARAATVAVWGTGADVVYPKENKKLADEILELGGSVVSELPLGTFPAPQNFPRRNRIISGLSVGVLVVEAAENSGTRVTARCAAEQNRDLFAVPGNVTNKGSWTPNTLIKQGAKLVATWEDVWEELPSQTRLELEDELPGGQSFGATASLLDELPLRPGEGLVLEHLRVDEATQLDDLLERLETQLTSSEVFTALFELEIAGRVRQLPGKNYLRSL